MLLSVVHNQVKNPLLESLYIMGYLNISLYNVLEY